MKNFIVQWFRDSPYGLSVFHKKFTDETRARAFAKALTLKEIQTVPQCAFTQKWVKVYGGKKIEKEPIPGPEWEQWQEENPNFFWSTLYECFQLTDFPAQGISLYEGELF